MAITTDAGATTGESTLSGPSGRSPEQQFALLARMLHRLGYRDALAGHLTWRQPSGHLLANPFPLGWDELRASDVCLIDLDGRQLSGPHQVSRAIELHLSLHRRRPFLDVILHNHPDWGTVWAGARRVPPPYDQTSANLGTDIVSVPYSGPVLDRGFADQVAIAMRDAEVALLENHGVLIVADSIERALWRAYVLERSCRTAWRVEAMGGGHPLSEQAVSINRRILDESFGGLFPGFFDYLARQELRLDAGVLD
jgi:ribulose-5-phosphate 4-epimerase/fuculose-1-phosphate aldolase